MANRLHVSRRTFLRAAATRTRPFVLEMGFSGPMTINGVSMDMDRIDQTIKVDDTEIWEVTNGSDLPHPFHVHDVQFLDPDTRWLATRRQRGRLERHRVGHASRNGWDHQPFQ